MDYPRAPEFDEPAGHPPGAVPCPRCPRVLLVALQDPRSFFTLSGSAQELCRELERVGRLAGTLAVFRPRPWDFVTGAVELDSVRSLWRPDPRTVWVWSDRGSRTISRRFTRALRRRVRAPFDAVLEIGTHLRGGEAGVPHFRYTDTTVPQCHRAGHFGFGPHLRLERYERAVRLQREMLARTRQVFSMSRWAAESMVEELDQPEERVRVVGGGATLPKENAGPRPMPLGPPEVVFVGRDWERKGGPLLVEAFGHVRRVLPEARLTIVGGDREVSAPGVRREGFLDRNEEPSRQRLEECYRRATVMCLPSHFDPFGLALLESQIRGVPVLTFGAEGRTDAVIDGVTGRLLWDRRPEALAAALLELLTNPALAQALGEQGRQWARANATWEHVARRCLGYMCESLAADRAAGNGANGHGAAVGAAS